MQLAATVLGHCFGSSVTPSVSVWEALGFLISPFCCFEWRVSQF